MTKSARQPRPWLGGCQPSACRLQQPLLDGEGKQIAWLRVAPGTFREPSEKHRLVRALE